MEVRRPCSLPVCFGFSGANHRRPALPGAPPGTKLKPHLETGLQATAPQDLCVQVTTHVCSLSASHPPPSQAAQGAKPPGVTQGGAARPQRAGSTRVT